MVKDEMKLDEYGCSADLDCQKRILAERRQRAERILSAIRAETETYLGLNGEIDGIQANLEFRGAPHLWQVERDIREGKIADEASYILRFGTPIGWLVESPFFYGGPYICGRGITAEKAVERYIALKKYKESVFDDSVPHPNEGLTGGYWRIGYWIENTSGTAGAFVAGRTTKIKVGDVIRKKGKTIKVVHIGKELTYDDKVKAVTIYWRAC